MYVVISKFRVRNGMEEDVLQAFCARPHAVDDAQGFRSIEVLRPTDTPEEFWLITHWACAQDFQSWYRGHSYSTSHKGIPKGLKLDPSQTMIRHFEQIAS